MSLANSNSKAMVSPAAILMLTSSLSSNLGSLGRCLQNKNMIFIFPPIHASVLKFSILTTAYVWRISDSFPQKSRNLGILSEHITQWELELQGNAAEVEE